MPTNTDTLPAPRTRDEALAALAPFSYRKLIANNTRVMRGSYRAQADPAQSGDDMIIRFYETDIVTFRADGWVEFKVGGSASTILKNRLNRYAPEGTRFFIRDRSLFFVREEGADPIRVTEGMQYDTRTRRVRHQRVAPVGPTPPRLDRNPAPTEVIDTLEGLQNWLRQFTEGNVR